MPHHHYRDYWWEDMPEPAQKAANVLGYIEKNDWDQSKEVPYTVKEFKDLSQREKQAAMFLGMDPMDKLEEAWWEDLDEATKEAALVLGWDQHKWDDDWEIEDLPCEEWWWRDMTKEQRQAARYFGYDRSTWDGEDYEDEYKSDDEEEFVVVKKPDGVEENNAPSPDAENIEEQVESPVATASAAAEAGGKKTGTKKPSKTTAKPRPKAKFACSQYFGGDGGGEFDHRNHPSIQSVTVRAGAVVDGISITYRGGTTMSSGGEGGNAETLKLQKGEYINTVKVRSNKLVQCLTFTTNKGRTLGPCGGKGAFMIDKEGEEVEVKAPNNCQLCGLKGRGGKYLDAIAFRWGPIPASN